VTDRAKEDPDGFGATERPAELCPGDCQGCTQYYKDIEIRYPLAPPFDTMGLPEDHFDRYWNENLAKRSTSREAIGWLYRYHKHRQIIEGKVARIMAAAAKGNVTASVLEVLIREYPGTLAPRADKPDCFRVHTVRCPLDTPKKVMEALGIQALVDLLARRGIELDEDFDPENDVHIAEVLHEAKPYIEGHKAWVGYKWAPAGLLKVAPHGGLCPVCGWEAKRPPKMEG